MVDSLSSFIGVIQFSSATYLLMLTGAVLVYFAFPGARTRAVWLLVVSSAFYLLLSPGSFPILLAVAAMAYAAGLALGWADRNMGESGDAARRWIVGATVVALVGALVIFKYLGFLGQIGNAALGVAGLSASLPVLRIALPLGISFWVFQTVAYVVDVYRREIEPERNLLYFLASVTFFPVVTSGPITRIQSLVEQLDTKHQFDYEGMQSGLLLIARGFFKKVMVADRLVVFVDAVFAHPRSYQGNTTVLLIAAVFFALQLYFDFSGYTDIVRGSARLFGVELPINFRAPYFAHSVQDFWRRWHMTLMDWLKRYVYIPLGGNRKGTVRQYVNLLVVFAVSGLWHGAGVTYLVWGLLNGAYQIAGRLLAPARSWTLRALRIDPATAGHRVLQTVMTFTLITIAWVFFRANSMSDALFIVTRMFVPTPWTLTSGALLKQGLSAAELGVALISAFAVFGVEWVSLRSDLLGALRAQHVAYRWAFYYVLILAVVVFGAYGGVYAAANFVYFKY